ncbi:MAG: hypothetical protein ACXWB2_20635, partial [Acidimicrobiales bacterium]
MTTRVRPITVMAAAAVVALVLAGAFAWTREDSTVVGQPSPLPILVGARVEPARAPASTTIGSRTYVPGPALVDPGGSLAAWWVAGGDPDPAAVRRLADAFGVSGDLRRVDGAWQIGADGESAVRVSTSPGTSWTYWPGGYPVVGIVCAAPATPPAVGSDASTGSTSSGDAGIDACTSTPAPEDLPSATEAEDAARDLLRRAGIDVAHMRIAATADEWSASTTATPELDGTPTHGLDTVVSFGSHAAITSASGWLAEPRQGDSYPLIGIDAAIGRLNDGQDLLDGLVPL